MMVTDLAPETGIPLQDTKYAAKQIAAAAGFTTLVFLLPGISSLARGDWKGVLVCIAIPAAAAATGWACERFAPDAYLRLYADRIEFPRWRGEARRVLWSDVEAIRWPKPRNSEARIEIVLPKSAGWPLARAPVDLRSLSAEDRLLLIRCLRMNAADKEQAGWPPFCQKRAVPLVEALKKRETDDGASERPLAGEFLNRHLFLVGLLSPLLIARLVSREMWWTTAGIIALSGVVNIRLAWGRWVSPFTEVVMGAAAAMAVIGLFSRSRGRDKPHEISWLSAATSLTAAFVGFPLLGNAVVQGWLKIPRQVLGWTSYAALLVLLWPALAYRFRTLRREKQQAPALEADALRRWDTYIETGELPPPADAPVT